MFLINLHLQSPLRLKARSIQAAKQNLTNVPPSHTKQNTHQPQNREQNLYDDNDEDSGFIHHDDDDDDYSKSQNAHKYDDDNDDLRPKQSLWYQKRDH